MKWAWFLCLVVIFCGRVEPVHELVGHRLAITSLAFDSTGRILASSSQDRSIKFWEVPGFREIRSIEAELPIQSLAFHPDGELLVCVREDNSVISYQVATGEKFQEIQAPFDDPSRIIFAYHPSGASTASSVGSELILQEIATGRKLHSFRGHTGEITALAFHPDGAVLASGGVGRNVFLWDTGSGEAKLKLSFPRPVQFLGFDPTGNFLAVGGFKSNLRFHDSKGGEALEEIVLDEGYFTAIAFQPEGRLLATGSSKFSIHIWDTKEIFE